MACVADRPVRLESLTGLRFVAAALVFAFHASFEGFFADERIGRPVAFALSKAGWVGVSFFFVLSGLVMALSARPGDSAARFWRRRAARIYPSHLLTTLAALALALAFGASALDAAGIWPQLLLVQSWSLRPEIYAGGNPVSWSLACEAVFYLAFPWLWRHLRAIPAHRLTATALALVAAVTALPLAASLLPATPLVTMPDGTSGQWQFWLVYVAPPVRALEFTLGILIARIVREGRWKGPRPLPAALLLAAAYLAALNAPYLYSLVALTLVPLALLTGAVAHAEITGRPLRLAGPVWIRLGELSFAFYLLHRLVLIHGHQLLGSRAYPTPLAAAAVLGAFAVSLLLAQLLRTAVEQPFVRRFATPRPAPHPPGGPPPAHPTPHPHAHPRPSGGARR
ncbi:acyltransferase family protein [Streptomyces purpureus]|uniref:acyltransferase family protein n=1 Tax=Streptomyces purpureus TaxID=1951 RepID=UPI0037B96627